MNCHYCGKEVVIKDRVFRQDVCANCGSALHCCLNCRFYDEKAYQQCHEPLVDRVTDKAAANFCTYFEPSDRQGGQQKARADEARKKLEELFGNAANHEEDDS